MASEIISRDQNRVTVLAGITDDSNQEIRMARVDHTTGRLKVSGPGSGVGATGATGATGAQGATGAAGIDGATGATGPAGSPGGATGATGPAGTPGAQGATGATGAGGTPGGSDTQVQYNNAGAFGGVSGATSNGTNITFGSGNLRATSPQVTTQISDANGNAMLRFSPTGSATQSLAIENNTATNAVSLTANAATVAASSQAGTGFNLSASAATAGNTNAGAAAGGGMAFTTGAASRLTSGNANGGDFNFTMGAGIGTGTKGVFRVNGASANLVIGDIFSISSSRQTITWEVSGATRNFIVGSFGGGNDLVFGGSTEQARIQNAVGFNLISGNTIGFNSTSSPTAFIGSSASGTIRLGQADAASPVAQTLAVQNVVAGTSNTAGANFTIAGSRGTGTGVGGDIIFQVAAAGSTGTSQNSLATAVTIKSTGNVGIGATSPATRLDLGGGALTRLAMSAPSTPATDSVATYVTASGTTPNREVSLNAKMPDGSVYILASVLV